MIGLLLLACIRCGPADAPGINPSEKYLLVAHSDDGVNWSRTSEVLVSGASSPHLMLLNNTPTVFFVQDGKHLATVPLEGGPVTPIAMGDTVAVDPHVIDLDEGGFRMFFVEPPSLFDPGVASENTIRTALSTDGVVWNVEPESRIVGPYVDPDVVALPDGQHRMYLTQGGRVLSAQSPDGQTFAIEAGLRQPIGGVTSVVEHPDGWWMFTTHEGRIWKSSSTNGLDFDAPQVVLSGIPDTIDGGGVESPSVLHHDGKWWMVYASWPAQMLPPL